MQRRTTTVSSGGQIIAYKLDPGVFVVEVPETGRKISLGQPPDVIKRLQQVGYAGRNGVTTFVLVDSKLQGDSISWSLTEFPILYALYYITVDVNGVMLPAFHAGHKPMLVGLDNDVRKAMAMIKYGNYGVDHIEEFDALDIPPETRDALKRETLGLAVGNEIKNSEAFIEPVYLDPAPASEGQFSAIGDGISVGRIAFDTYRFVYKRDHLDVNVTLEAQEDFRSPVEYKHLKFPVLNFGVWHTGEFDGMDPYYSCAHTTLIHKYEPVLVDYPSNMTDILNHNGLSKESVRSVLLTHNHDDHIGALVELFRRSQHAHLITTAPTQYTVVKKLAALVDLPEQTVRENFRWTVLPFRRDNPYQTETINLEGLRITGHLSCHSVPTTIYTFASNHDGYEYTYGHFLDIVAFRRMEKLVQDGWMPEAHLSHLRAIIQKTAYNLIKYDAGCTSDAALSFTVHAQWQDLIGAATPRAQRVFTHASKQALDPAYETEGRFVSVGDTDATVLDKDGRVVRLGGDKTSVTAFYTTAYRAVLAYFRSLLPSPLDEATEALMQHYAGAFANCPKQPDPNIGGFLFEQGEESRSVLVMVRGRAEIVTLDKNGERTFRSVVGDGEVLGDIGVISGRKRMSSIKSLNRLSYVSVPGSLFIEAMQALGIVYEGHFKELFERRMAFQSAADISRDVSTLVLNHIARASRTEHVRKGQHFYEAGQRDGRLMIVPKGAELQVGKRTQVLAGPTVIGECELFLSDGIKPTVRLHSAVATVGMDVLTLESAEIRNVPVIVDNLRHLIRERRRTIYTDLPQIDPTLE